jgi:hypothetical protein
VKPKSKLTISAVQDEFLDGDEAVMGLQFFSGSIDVDGRRLQDVRALLLSSRYVLPIVDAPFERRYRTAFGHPFFDGTQVPEYCCIVSDQRFGHELHWADAASEVPCLAEIDGGTLPSGFDQRVQLQSALASLTSSPPPTPGSPAGPVVPPPGTLRPLSVTTSGDDGFIRFTFAVPDPRVNSKTGHVRPGTFCTPYRDGQRIVSGLEAVARFALPVPLPYKHLLLLVPPPRISMTVGAVAPAFGQSGGGVEVLFPSGFTNPNLHYHSLPSY